MIRRLWLVASLAALVVGCARDPGGLLLGDGGAHDASVAVVDLARVPDLVFVPAPAAGCSVESMETLYSGPFPTNPYGAVPKASSCIAAQHDVIILLGCPANSDGSPATCQTKRADIAVALRDRGFGDRFITTGAAVANSYVEAEVLRDLLVARGVPAAAIVLEPQARHTDENLYYSTRLMEARGWASALVVSEDPGHLIMTAVCDSNCCVELGRLTVLEFALPSATKVGHYVRYPWATAVSTAECAQIEQGFKLMCSNQNQRLACADDFKL